MRKAFNALTLLLLIALRMAASADIVPGKITRLVIEFDASKATFNYKRAPNPDNPSALDSLSFTDQKGRSAEVPMKVLTVLSFGDISRSTLSGDDWERDAVYLSIPLKNLRQIADRKEDDKVVFVFEGGKYTSGWVMISMKDGGQQMLAFKNRPPNFPAEQAGAGQPATRPESKSEGGDKPQPKSEGRSR